MAEGNARIILVLGGARSGKSSFALSRASGCSGRRAYIATAQALDAEMEERIRKHKLERGSDWDTIEEPVRLGEVIHSASLKYDVVLVDCLTLWVSNLLCGCSHVEKKVEGFPGSLLTAHPSSLLYIVTNEVGMGIVPDNALSRKFRDLAGRLNQKVAEISDEVYLVTAGMPLRIKP